MIPLLDPSVETLADYGAGTAVRLRDRAHRLRLLVWPRGPAHRFARHLPGPGGRRRPSPPRRPPTAGSCDIQGRRTRTYEIEAALGSLGRRRVPPCCVRRRRSPGRTPVSGWRYDRATGVFKLRMFARDALVVVRSCRD